MMKVDGVGSFEHWSDNDVRYRIEDEQDGMVFECRIEGRMPWDESEDRRGPEGPLANLGHLLGQHWVSSATLIML